MGKCVRPQLIPAHSCVHLQMSQHIPSLERFTLDSLLGPKPTVLNVQLTHVHRNISELISLFTQSRTLIIHRHPSLFVQQDRKLWSHLDHLIHTQRFVPVSAPAADTDLDLEEVRTGPVKLSPAPASLCSKPVPQSRGFYPEKIPLRLHSTDCFLFV